MKRLKFISILLLFIFPIKLCATILLPTDIYSRSGEHRELFDRKEETSVTIPSGNWDQYVAFYNVSVSIRNIEIIGQCDGEVDYAIRIEAYDGINKTIIERNIRAVDSSVYELININLVNVKRVKMFIENLNSSTGDLVLKDITINGYPGKLYEDITSRGKKLAREPTDPATVFDDNSATFVEIRTEQWTQFIVEYTNPVSISSIDVLGSFKGYGFYDEMRLSVYGYGDEYTDLAKYAGTDNRYYQSFHVNREEVAWFRILIDCERDACDKLRISDIHIYGEPKTHFSSDDITLLSSLSTTGKASRKSINRVANDWDVIPMETTATYIFNYYNNPVDIDELLIAGFAYPEVFNVKVSANGKPLEVTQHINFNAPIEINKTNITELKIEVTGAAYMVSIIDEIYIKGLKHTAK